MSETISARAVWFAGPRAVEIRAERVPPPGPGQIRVRAIASAISHGSEILVYRGQVDPDLPLDLPTLAGGFGFPIKYGYASVGEVIDVGPGVAGLAVGDHVFCLHPHQSVYLTPAGLAMRLPEGLDPALGVFCANLETALNIVHDTPLRLGETAVVFGQGVVGLLVTQLLRMAGAARVLAVEPAESRRGLALAAGADAALEPGPDLPERLRAANGGRAADVAVEVSGAPAALQGAIACVLDEGTVVVASWYGRKPVTLDLGGHFHRGRVTLRGSQVGRLSPGLAPRWDHARRSEAVAALLPRLRLAELISRRMPLERAAEAYALVDSGAEGVVQVVLAYNL
ncbi:zinc-binding dehydrogenase [Oscillochloris sp. ZM17-4]|uniref:zinc-binding dehydrogenase n=1 Tax=Oscillochloris sp. ZM17-4 TaxID=2866714 RepID=UPI001C73236E|nr:zinc-binding dehydrogenase [Oscillochloris sp. ZM17-4]MBX0327223.1 zinc-binding dehydrogenase [Oscillochloris sp. ZM17-4]